MEFRRVPLLQKVRGFDADGGEGLISRIEISFALEVELTDEESRWLQKFADRVAKRHEPEGWVHWASGCGSKPLWSQRDAAFLGHEVDPNAPVSGEPSWDSGTFFISTSAREAYPEEIARKAEKLAAKEKRHRSLNYRVRRLIYNALQRLAEAV
jgi:hypothetical protein